MNEELYWFWLCSLLTIGSRTGHKLIEYFGSAEDIFKSEIDVLSELPFLNKKMLEELSQKRDISDVKRLYEKMLQGGYHFIYENSKEYPEKLKNIYDYPMGFFYRGQLPDMKKPIIAIVGARYCSGYGRVQSHCFGKVLSEAGIKIISGMALGIDGAAHRGALETGQDTYAVLGCGLDTCYPIENRDLYEKIPQNGGLISEYPMGRPPLHWQFPMRNRLIAGFADKVLVVEARKRSGSLITADYALNQGKDVLAIPGRSKDDLSAGCLELIKSGARLVTSPEEILEDYQGMAVNLKKNNIYLAKTEKLVYSSLCLKPKYLEDICDELQMDLRSVILILCRLENMGLIRQIYKNQYVLCL